MRDQIGSALALNGRRKGWKEEGLGGVSRIPMVVALRAVVICPLSLSDAIEAFSTT